MSGKNIRIILFSLLVLLFTGIPLVMIYRYNNVVEKGKLYRFRCEPVDPIDAFRGKYVQLRFSQKVLEYSPGDSIYKTGQKVFAFLKLDSAGYAYVSRVSTTEGQSNDYFATTIDFVSSYDGVRVDFPFDRYYMNEKTAPLAEDAYRNEVKIDSVYLDVKVYHGRAVGEELYLGGVPIRQYLEKYNQKK